MRAQVDRGHEEERPRFVRSGIYNGQGEGEMEQVRRGTLERFGGAGNGDGKAWFE